MDSESVAFWGISLEPGKPMHLELKSGETLHVSMASLGTQLKDPKGRSVVTVETDEMKKAFAVCALNAGSAESSALDIQFEGEEKVSFSVTGKNEVHLTGNFSFDDEDEDDGEDLLDMFEDNPVSMEEDSEEESGEEADSPMNQPPVIAEVKDSEEENKPTAAAKPGSSPQSNGKKSKKEKKAEKKKKKQELKKQGEQKEEEQKPTENPKSPEPKKPNTPEVEKKTPKSTGKRKGVDMKVATPAKKAKAPNGDAVMKTPEAKSAAASPNGNSQSAKKIKRKRRSKAGNTPHAKAN